MNAKGKGTAGERELIRMFWAAPGWSAHRIAGSGSNSYPSPDIIAGSRTRKLAIEAKVTSDTRKYFDDAEIKGLLDFCDIFGAEPWIAVRFPKTDWLFVTVEELETSGKNRVLSLERARMLGAGFGELVGDS